ncbi:MAG: class I SAM-dependent methyltransferase [Pseudomonadota bacterium]
MIGTGTIDPGSSIDWGNTSDDYAKFRPGPPLSFYHKLKALDVGLPGQKILDLGTGTGVLARQFASQGCHVTGTDIAAVQINMAQKLAAEQGLNIDFKVMAAEDSDFPDHSFDVITANQCHLYFDHEKLFPKIKRILKEDGLFMVSHFSWLPLLDKIAEATEQLILKHNPNWTGHSYAGNIPPINVIFQSDFKLKGYFYYDQAIEFSRASWRGRIRASRGIAASLTAEAVKKFDAELDQLLSEIAPETFAVLHRLDAHIMIIK